MRWKIIAALDVMDRLMKAALDQAPVAISN